MRPVLPTRIYRYLLALFAAFLLSYTSTVTALELSDLFKRSDQRAVELLESGQAEAASAEFKDPQWRGVSRYKAGLYQEAMEDFSLAEDAEGLYNHGTAAARAGDYTQSVASLEQALKLAPDDTNIAHNLEIARQLRDMAEDQSQEGSPQDQQPEDSEDNQSEDDSSESEQQSESPEQNNEDQEGNDPQDGQGEQGEQSDSNSEENQNPGDAEQNDGEMNEDESDQSSEQQQDAEELRDMMQQEQQGQQNEAQQEDQQQQMAVTASDSVSEDDQATEQWLRRIPDDASQLLRNKIRLNHLIEYPEVQDMQEPW